MASAGVAGSTVFRAQVGQMKHRGREDRAGKGQAASTGFTSCATNRRYGGERDEPGARGRQDNFQTRRRRGKSEVAQAAEVIEGKRTCWRRSSLDCPACRRANSIGTSTTRVAPLLQISSKAIL